MGKQLINLFKIKMKVEILSFLIILCVSDFTISSTTASV